MPPFTRLSLFSSVLASALMLGLASTGAGPAQALSPQSLPVTRLKIGSHAIQAEVADSEDERSRGLMFRTSMPEDHGMLFVFEQPGQYCFWMKNTLIPLAIAFIDDAGRIVDIAEMKARDDRNHHCPRTPVRMALEMNQGWFGARGLTVGAEVQGLPPVTKAPSR